MSRIYEDETGIVFHYNPDLSGGVTIVVPPNNPYGDGTEISIEADVLSRFFLSTMLTPYEILKWVEEIREWVNRHNFGPILPNADAYKFKVGDKVLLTFAEARGQTGVVTDTGRWPKKDGGSYEYADVKLDRDGTQTGPLPVTCAMHQRPEKR